MAGQGGRATFFGSLVGWAPGDHRPGHEGGPFQARLRQTLAFLYSYLALKPGKPFHRLRGWVGLGAGEERFGFIILLIFIKVRYKVLEKRTYTSQLLGSQWVVWWAGQRLGGSSWKLHKVGHSICPRGLRKGLSDWHLLRWVQQHQECLIYFQGFMHVKNKPLRKSLLWSHISINLRSPWGGEVSMGVVASGGLCSEHLQVRTERAGQRPYFSHDLTWCCCRALQADGSPTLREESPSGGGSTGWARRHQPTLSHPGPWAL